MKKCPVCGKFLKTTTGLRIHMTKMHPEENNGHKFNGNIDEVLELITKKINDRVVLPLIEFIERMEEKLSSSNNTISITRGMIYLPTPPQQSEEEQLWQDQNLKNYQKQIEAEHGIPVQDILMRQELHEELKKYFDERFVAQLV